MKTYFATNPALWYRHMEQFKPHATIPDALAGKEMVRSYKMVVNEDASAYDSFAFLLGRGWISVSVQKPMTEKTRELLAEEVRRGHLYERLPIDPKDIRYTASAEL